MSDLVLALRQDRALQAGMMLGEPASAAWAVRQQDPALKAAPDEYLSNVRRTATWSRPVVEYFGEDALTVLGRASEK